MAVDIIIEEEYGYRYWVLEVPSMEVFHRAWCAQETVEIGFHDPENFLRQIGTLREVDIDEYHRRCYDGSSPLHVHMHEDDDSRTCTLPFSKESVETSFEDRHSR